MLLPKKFKPLSWLNYLNEIMTRNFLKNQPSKKINKRNTDESYAFISGFVNRFVFLFGIIYLGAIFHGRSGREEKLFRFIVAKSANPLLKVGQLGDNMCHLS